jgi:exopolysaccharide production protein ExoY
MSFEPVEIVSDLPHAPLAPNSRAKSAAVAKSPDFRSPDFRSSEYRSLDVESQGAYRRVFKRLIDVTLVLLSAPLVLMLVLPLMVWIWRDGHSPIYWSDRVGRRGRIFRMMKLRTMVPDADARLEAHLAAHPEDAAEWAETQKLKCDPRITGFGRFLRKSSLDELPQLWNVLKGDMSLVGPRPMMPNQRKLYPGRAYYALRPGITGSWQVSDRNESTFVARADYDLDYSHNVTLKTDIGLIWRTLSVVLRGTGY